MISLTAIIQAKPGHADLIRQALLDVGTYVDTHEPGTIGYHVTQATEDPCTFVTYERFESTAAMEAHNAGAGSAAFFAAAEGKIESVIIKTGDELFSL